MSTQNTPSKDESSTSMYNSALENLTSSSLNDSVLENTSTKLNTSPLDDLSESTLNFILCEGQNSFNSQKSTNNEFDSSLNNISEPSLAIDSSHIHSEIDLRGEGSLDEVIVISSEDDSSIDLSHDNKSTKDVNNPIELENTIKIYKSIEEFEKNLPSTVSILKTPFGSKVYLVGTAHFSKESQDDVSLVIRNVQPDVVMVELCPSRIHILRHDEKTLLEEASDINIAKIRNIINTNGVINGIFYILLLNMSAKLTKELGMAPGGEFRRALEEVHRLQNCVLQLGDRPINITLQRALHGLSFWQTLKIVWKLMTSNEKISKEEVEQCKQKDLLEELMQEMAGEYPAFRDVFVSERDLYLCHSLQVAALPQPQSNGPPRPVNVVGVVGIGHSAGITQHWGKVDSDKIPEIVTIPPASLSNRIFRFTLKYGMLGLIGYGVYKIARPRLTNIL